MKIFNKHFLFIILTTLSITCYAQKNVPVSGEINITGDILQQHKISIDDLKQFKPLPIGDLTILNHMGEQRGALKNMKGILLKHILEKVVLTEENPKLFSEYFITAVATDGYKIVFSWNEIFNSIMGEKVFIVTEKDGISFDQMDDRILLICTGDVNTGRRHVKGLSEIRFQRVK